MKVKTSVSISEDLLGQLDQLLIAGGSRSAVLEQALREYLVRHRRRQRDARDLEILNARANELNDEALDVLEFQADV